MTAYHTAVAPAPAGPYSQARQAGNILALAGQVGIDPGTGKLAGEDITAQARQAFQNLAVVLQEAGADFSDVIMLRVYLSDGVDISAVNDVVAAQLRPPYPSRTTVYVGLPAGMLIEVDALAVVSTARP